MAIWFVSSGTIVAAPSDTNDGRDAIGFGLSSATFTNSTKTLTSTGAFSSYTFSAGDEIYISGGTGVTAGLYEIASKTSSDAIVLVDDIGGTNPSDVTSSDGPFASIPHAFNTGNTGNTSLLGGDEIRVCGTFLFTSATGGVEADTNLSGSYGSLTKIVGCNSRGVEDGTVAVIKADGSTKFSPLFKISGAQYCVARNFDIDGDGSSAKTATNGVDSRTVGSSGWDWIDSSFHGMGSDGVYLRGQFWRFTRCHFYDNGGDGFTINGSSDKGTFFDCRSFDNGGNGFEHGRGAAFHYCSSYNNGGDGYRVASGAADDHVYSNCLAFDNGGDGFYSQANDAFWDDQCIVNCTSTNNGGYGYSFRLATHTTAEQLHINMAIGFCHSHGNTLGHTNLPETFGVDFMDFAGLDDTFITGDPLFTSTSLGSEDFTPQAGSPLIGAGAGGSTIGPENPVGGGGGSPVTRSWWG